MKRILNKIIAFSSIGLLVLPACKKGGELVTSNGGKAGNLTASVTTLPLDKTKLNDTSSVITFSFSAPGYGFSAAVNNTLQIDVPGDNWKNPTSATLSTKVYSQGYSTAAFNNLVLKLNVPAGVATPIEVRVMHTISASVAPIYSNVLTLTVTAFNLTSYVYVPGAYQGWNPPTADSLVSVTGNGVYVGIINFTAGNNQFLVTPDKTWANKYATTAPAQNPTTATVTDAVSYDGPNNFYAPTTAGNYLVTLNINTNTMTIVPADYYSIVGDAAAGWGTDIPLKFINDGNNNWVANNVAMTVATPPNDGWKIRQDDAWSFSWGTGSTPGVLTDASGVNIGISTAGNYNVTFNMAPTPYGTQPVATAAYTATKQ